MSGKGGHTVRTHCPADRGYGRREYRYLYPIIFFAEVTSNSWVQLHTFSPTIFVRFVGPIATNPARPRRAAAKGDAAFSSTDSIPGELVQCVGVPIFSRQMDDGDAKPAPPRQGQAGLLGTQGEPSKEKKKLLMGDGALFSVHTVSNSIPLSGAGDGNSKWWWVVKPRVADRCRCCGCGCVVVALLLQLLASCFSFCFFRSLPFPMPSHRNFVCRTM